MAGTCPDEVVRVMAPRRPRAIGTAAESAVVAHLRGAGFPHAERRALRGPLDAGDITGTPGVCWEVKGGKEAKAASDGLIEKWLEETTIEQCNAGADVGILVVQRAGIGAPNAGSWWAIMNGWHYEILCCGRRDGWRYGDRGPIRMHLHQVCALLRYAGYGSEA